MSLRVENNEIWLTGVVGGDGDDDGDSWFSMDGFDAMDVVKALAEVGRDKDVVLHVNSPGGIAYEGAAIHASIAQHKGKVTLLVEGAAASAASLLAMAADEIVMTAGSIMMIHDPAALAIGNAETMEKAAEMLNTLGDTYASVYADRAKITPERARAIMREETWLTPQQAVKQGFADRTEKGGKAYEPAAFAYSIYSKAPASLLALASSRGWKAPGMITTRKENPAMTETTKAAASPPGGDPAPAAPAVPAAPAAPSLSPAGAAGTEAVAAAVAQASEIAKMCTEGGVPAMAAALIAGGKSLIEAKAAIEGAKEIRTAVEAAARMNSAIDVPKAVDEFVKAGATVETVRATLFARVTAGQSKETSSALPDHRPSTSAAWNAHVEKLNARIPGQ